MQNLYSRRGDKFCFTYGVGMRTEHTPELHCHEYYEIYYFKNCRTSYFVEGVRRELEPNTLLLIPPGVYHGYIANDNARHERYVLELYPEILTPICKKFFLNLFKNNNSHAKICYTKAEAFNIGDYFDNIRNCQSMNFTIEEPALVANIHSLIFQIANMVSIDNDESEKTSLISEKINQIIIYINEHIKENFTLDDISNSFFISKHHLNKVFKNATGTTVMQYILYRKIIFARGLIKKGMKPITASEELGFNDYSNFYKSYVKIIGHSPTKKQ